MKVERILLIRVVNYIFSFVFVLFSNFESVILSKKDYFRFMQELESNEPNHVTNQTYLLLFEFFMLYVLEREVMEM